VSAPALMGAASIACYLAAAALLGLRLASREGGTTTARGGLAGLVLAGVALHAVVLYQGIVTDAGLALGLANAASLVAWAVAVFLLLVAVAHPVADLGVFVLPLAAASVVAGLAAPGGRVLAPDLGVGLQTHIVISVVAYSVLTIAALQALVLAFQDSRLRARRPAGLLSRLPPLQSQETLLFRLIGVGFFLLSLSLVSGIVFVEDLLAQHLVHKTALSVTAWVVFAVLLWGRWRHGWRGRTAIAWSLGGFASLMLAYFGAKFVLEQILGRAWYGG